MKNLTGAEAAALRSMALQHLGTRAMAARTVPEWAFTLTNETLSLLPYRQAALFLCDAKGRLVLHTASGLTTISEDSPYSVWLTRLASSWTDPAPSLSLSLANAPAELAEGWGEWLPEHLVVCRLSDPEGRHLGSACYARDEAFTEAELQALEHLHAQHGYCLWALQRQARGALLGLRQMAARAKFSWVVLAAVAVLAVPIRQTALAPAEVTALNARAIAAPQEGVIGAVAVQPNQKVKAGDLLFSLEPSALAGRRNVAAQALAVAKADALLAEQRAFDDPRSKGELASSAGRVKEKYAELAALEAQAARVEVHAEQDGVAVFADANEWLGKPVQIGERVMQLANPQEAGVVVWLPVNDALALEPGAPVRLFLHSQPLQPVDATLQETSYQASVGPDGVAALRLRAALAPGQALPHIGLRGTARVAGEWAPLGLYLLRRPLATLRIWTGL